MQQKKPSLFFLIQRHPEQIDSFGKFINDSEPKLAWFKREDGGSNFLFLDSFKEMLEDFAIHQPQIVANGKKVAYDWTIYYLRKKERSYRRQIRLHM